MFSFSGTGIVYIYKVVKRCQCTQIDRIAADVCLQKCACGAASVNVSFDV